MAEREKICILCGQKEIMPGYICTSCQDRIQREAVDQRQAMLQEASGNNRGGNPDDEHKKS